MVCKMLFFDFRDNDKLFFEKNNLPNYDIKFFKHSLNKKTVKDLSPEELELTASLSVFTPSLLSADVINEFPNLRVISTRSKDCHHIDLKACLERNIAVVNVDLTDRNNEVLHSTFKAVTGVLCGCKENRVV